MIYIGADHGGFKLKETISKYLKQKAYSIEDLGAFDDKPSDYPLIALKVARKTAEDPNNRGILVCRTGAGVCIVANKVPGVWAAQAQAPEQIKKIRGDEGINVLCLAADYLEEKTALEIVQNFLDTSVGGEERHKQRRMQLQEIEKGKL